MPQNKKYTATDFERYHSGKMNEREMHTLEKAALADSFLADALEGYAYTNSPVKDIAELREKLLAKKKKKNIFLIQSDNKWLRIAAIFILIAGIGYMAFELNFNKENNTLAKKQNTDFKKITEQPAIPKMDPPSNNEKNLVTLSPSEKSNGPLINKNTRKIPKPDLTTDNSLAKNAEKPNESFLQKDALAEPKKDYASSLSKINLLQGKVVDTLGNPVRYATIIDKNRKIMTTSDSTGKFKLLFNDTSLTATIAMIGYKTKISRLNYKNEQTIVMEPDNQSLNEVVVLSKGARRQNKELSPAVRLERKVPGITVNNSASEPVIGWQEFHQYLQNNINIPEDEEGMGFKGKVVLSFEINKRGNPQKIKIEQTLCPACDREAVRLITQGPKWKYIQDKRQQVTIQF